MNVGKDIICEYLERFPETPTLTLSKLIYKENKECFPRLEAVRSLVRYYRGQNGKYGRDKVSTKKYFKESGTKSPFESIPDGLKHFDEWAPVEIESDRTLILSDVHIPYHEKEPLVQALEYGVKHKCDGVLLNGDFLDFYSVSMWEKDPRRRNFHHELNIGKGILGTIREAFPKAHIYFLEGNHEARYFRYLQVKAPDLLGVPNFALRSILGLDDLNIELIDDKRIAKIGSLSVIHGHEFGRAITSPVNPARGLYLKGKDTALCSHFHRSSKHTEKSMNGEVIVCWSSGCLCDLRPDYRPINRWNHGFAVVNRIGKNGDFEVWLKDIIDGRIF